MGILGRIWWDLRSDLGARVWRRKKGMELPLNRPRVRWVWARFWAKTLSGFSPTFIFKNNKTFLATF